MAITTTALLPTGGSIGINSADAAASAGLRADENFAALALAINTLSNRLFVVTAYGAKADGVYFYDGIWSGSPRKTITFSNLLSIISAVPSVEPSSITIIFSADRV